MGITILSIKAILIYMYRGKPKAAHTTAELFYYILITLRLIRWLYGVGQ